MPSISRLAGIFLFLPCFHLLTSLVESVQGQEVPKQFASRYLAQVKPLLAKYCADCHSGKEAEAEFDLEQWTDAKAISKQLHQLQKFEAIVKSGQMPPKEFDQPTDREKQQLADWSNGLLLFHAQKHAGDPGPILLRRLNNSEFNYTIQDLTGISTLNPTEQFPVDGAAGEGFINTGAGQAMSPALLQKYFDAAKEISKQVVLLPNGIAFSPYQTDRDRVDDYLKRIRQFYGRYSDNSGGSAVNLQGIQFETNGGGRLPLQEYLRATIRYRDRQDPEQTLADFAAKNNLSPKYLQQIWQVLHSSDADSFLLDQIRRQWKDTSLDQLPELIAAIAQWQSRLWKFNSIGHLGREAGPKQWMEPIAPMPIRRSFRIPIPASDASFVTLQLGGKSLTAQTGSIRWIRPRIVTGEKNEILLRDVDGLVRSRASIQRQFLADTSKLLRACHVVQQKIGASRESDESQIIEKAASELGVQTSHLKVWLDFLGIHSGTLPVVEGHYQKKIRGADGHDFVQGWGSHQTPSILANLSDQQVRIPGIMKPRSVVVHPSPELYSACVWQSPVAGKIQLAADIMDHHPECGNGVQWALLHQTRRRTTLLWQGEVEQGKSSKLPPETLDVQKGDLVSFVVGPRAKSHACDLTQINLRIEAKKQARKWDLASELSRNILTSNPLADSYGNPGVWHFCKGNWSTVEKGLQSVSKVPVNSVLDRWLTEKESDARQKLEETIVKLLGESPLTQPDSPDAQMVELIQKLADPLYSRVLRQSLQSKPQTQTRGSKWTGAAGEDLQSKTSDSLSFEIPSDWAKGGFVVVDAELADANRTEPVQVFAQFAPLNLDRHSSATEVLIADNPRSRAKLLSSFAAFRKIFPAAVCYQKIVPVDEVVTLTLFHRDDQWLQDLFLSPKEIEDLNELWDEFIFVAQEPLKKVVALEQIYQFATQDRPDLVTEFKKLFEPTRNRAAAFREQQKAAEPLHLNSVLDFAKSVWRRPLSSAEERKLRSLYERLITEEVEHERAIQLLVARLLVSPEFLYRREKTQPGNFYSQVSSHELATRLSYFLWSSTPDDTLLELAGQDKLSGPAELQRQIGRMLSSEKSRRLAIQFACQWLHLRDFDKNDDKNEELFPEFEKLRVDMYEETVRYFEYLFRENRSILEVIDSDYGVLNPAMAQLYQIKFPAGEAGWQKIENLDRKSRGGILGMSTVLASQSGASRTSPILRGTWVSETLLGERMPKPPANIPQLPDKVPAGLTARELIEKHSSAPACAKCHARIDPYGFALEQFDVLGRHRPKKVNTQTRLFDGIEIDGLAGLKSYILNHRRDDFVRQFCRKLLGFALGRELQLSDEPLILEMMKKLKEDGFRFHTAVKTIVASEQFRHVRNLDYRR